MISKPSRPRHRQGAIEVKPTLAELAYQGIRQQILDFELPPGAVVSERLLAERLKTGKAPIRLALVRLAADGFVSIASRQGIVISTPSIQDVIELFQMRVPLELMIVRQVAGRLSREQAERLRANLRQYADAADLPESGDGVRIDLEFHRLLCEFHGNRQLAHVLDRVFNSLYRELRVAHQKFPGRITKSLEEHQAVAVAAIEGDAGAAERLMKEHLRFGEQFVLSRGSH